MRRPLISKLRLSFFILPLCITSLALSACNTVEGFGKDIKKAGESIEDVSK